MPNAPRQNIPVECQQPHGEVRTVIHLPSPARAWFFKAHGSFQGPVTLPA